MRAGRDVGRRAGRGARRRRPGVADRGRAGAGRAQPRAGQPTAPRPGPRPARRGAGDACSHPTTSRSSRVARPIAAASSTTRWSPWRSSTTPLRLELDRIVRQRNTLLSQVGGRLDADAATDARRVGRPLRRGRRAVRSCPRQRSSSGSRPFVGEAYAHLAGRRDRGRTGLRPGVAAHRPGRGAGRRPRRRRASRGVDRRSAPRRARAGDRRACRRARTRRRASSARWRSPCASAPTGWSPSAPGRRRCSCSTTCCPSSTRSGDGAARITCRRARS